MIRRLALIVCVATLVLPSSVPAAESVSLDQIATLVTYQPKNLSACGWLLDLAKVEENLSLQDKRQVIDLLQSGEEKQITALLADESLDPCLRLVRVQVELEQGYIKHQFAPCRVASITGGRVDTGFLLPTPLVVGDSRVTLGVASGFIDTSKEGSWGQLAKGVRLLESTTSQIVRDNQVALEIAKEYAGVVSIDLIAAEIREMMRGMFIQGDDRSREEVLLNRWVRVEDDSHITVLVPEVLRHDLFAFASQVMEIRHYLPASIEAVRAAKQATSSGSILRQ